MWLLLSQFTTEAWMMDWTVGFLVSSVTLTLLPQLLSLARGQTKRTVLVVSNTSMLFRTNSFKRDFAFLLWAINPSITYAHFILQKVRGSKAHPRSNWSLGEIHPWQFASPSQSIYISNRLPCRFTLTHNRNCQILYHACLWTARRSQNCSDLCLFMKLSKRSTENFLDFIFSRYTVLVVVPLFTQTNAS